MDAVGADQGVAVYFDGFAGCAVLEAGDDFIAAFLEFGELAGGVDAGGAEAGEGGFVQHGVQLAAVDGELRRVVAGVGAAEFGPDGLAEAVGVDQFAGADAGAVQRGQQAEGCEFLDRVGERVDSDAEFADFADLLEDFGLDAGLVEGQGCGEAADAAADDEDLHADLRP